MAAGLSRGNVGIVGAWPNLRILHVDDRSDIVEASSMLLVILGHVCMTAGDGAAAMHIAASFDPDLIIIDIGMPDMSGYEIVRDLRRRGTRAVLVALTGFATVADRQRAFSEGFDLHVPKPANIALLRQVLDFAEQRLQRAADHRDTSTSTT